MSAELAQTVARIHHQNGKSIAGLGFLVTPDHVLTHVTIVAQALNLEADDSPATGVHIQLDFPMHISRSSRKAHLIRVQDNIALLKIEAESSIKQSSVAMVKLQKNQFSDRKMTIVGFAEDVEQRLEASCLDLNASGHVQLKVSTGVDLAHMNGTLIWDSIEQGIIGQLVISEQTQAATMLPVSILLQACPELGSQWRPANPYRGLRPFREADKALFFGRETDTEELGKLLQKSPMCTLIGASGSGKTSLIYAGLLPKLRDSQNVFVLTIRPRADPFYELAKAMTPHLSGEGIFEELEQDKLYKLLNYSRDALIHQVQELLDREDKTGMLLVIDQFEEVFIASSDIQRRERFLTNLLRLVASPVSVCVLISVRAEFLSRVLEFPMMSKMLNKWPKKTLGAMGPSAFRQIIEQPATQLGVQMDPALVKRLLEELKHEPRLFSLLEFYLTLLWEKQVNRCLPVALLDELGSMGGCMTQYIDLIMKNSTQFQRGTIRSILLKLVSVGHESRCLFHTLGLDQFTTDERDLIPRLVDQRLLVIDYPPEGPGQVEIIHELLLREWPDLRQWVDERGQFDSWRVDLNNWVNIWKKNTKDEGYLLHGKLQLEAEENLERFTGDLSVDDKKFIRAGMRARKHRRDHPTGHKQWTDKKTMTGLAVALAVVVGYSSWQWWQMKVSGKEVMELADQARSQIQRSRIRSEEMEKLASLTIQFLVEQNPGSMEMYVNRIQNQDSHNALKALIETSVAHTESMGADERAYWRGVINSMDENATAQLLSSLFLKSDGVINLDYAQPE